MTTRAATYARFSTDMQNDRSVEDQVRLCEDYAARLGLRVVERFHDRPKSGAFMFGRHGLANMMLAAEAQAFDVLIAESTDRVSRDIPDLAHVHKRLMERRRGRASLEKALAESVSAITKIIERLDRRRRDRCYPTQAEI